MTCAILYTSRNKKAPNGVTTYQVEQLPEEGALCLLLEGTRPLLLSEVLSGSQDAEVDAARTVCQGLGTCHWHWYIFVGCWYGTKCEVSAIG